MREALYTLVKKHDKNNIFGRIYDYFIVCVAFLSLLPLMFKGHNAFLDAIDILTVYILFADYIFRWITCDYASGKKGVLPFIAYPFTLYAIFDLASLLPSMGLLSEHFRILRLFRIIKILRYSDNFQYIGKVFEKERKTLVSVLCIAVFYIFFSALAIFIHEPYNFDSFFEAMYWATVTLTTVGYGDVYPLTSFGRLISMVSSLFGVAIIALPAGIVAAGFVEEVSNEEEAAEDSKLAEKGIVDWRLNCKKAFLSAKTRRYALYMTAAVLINALLKLAAEHLDLPIWLDVTGTAFAAITLDVSAGLIVGLINNISLAITEYGAGSLFYYSISALVAITAGTLLKGDKKLKIKYIALTIFIVILGSAMLQTLVSVLETDGADPTTKWELYYYLRFISAGLPYYASFFLSALTVKFFDTIAVSLCVAAIYAAFGFILAKR